MIQLTITKNEKSHQKLKEYLEDKSLARKIVELDIKTTPTLVHGKEKYEGIKEIETYFEELDTVMKEWYACRCGNHGDFD